MSYLPIEDHAIIGNMRTAALVGTDGTIDWLCYPRFDSPAVFLALLDDEKGGRFQIVPQAGEVTHKQLYWPDTNVLITRFLSVGGVGEVIDYMPVTGGGAGERNWVVRQVTAVRGSMTFHMRCLPTFDYARQRHELRIEDGGACFVSPDLSLSLASSIPLRRDGDGVEATFTLEEEDSVIFVLSEAGEGDACVVCPSTREAWGLYRETISYWRGWIGQSTYQGRWREMVHRSALVLKLLTYGPSGAIVAAPTCGLPEGIGGERNWDYRYTWVRDAAFTLYAFMRIGFTEEAACFMKWLESRCHELGDGGTLQVMYGIDGAHRLTETTLDHLDGYCGSRPVRIGNGAYDQHQLDIYGELMDAVYLFNKYRTPISYDLWLHLRPMVDWVCEHWQSPDRGIWEVRGPSRHFVYSKLMCWVALDRALRLADKRSFPADRSRWLRVRDEIYTEIMDRGWNPQVRAFTQSYESDALDAANLIMPLVFFSAPTDPRMLATIDAIYRTPAKGGLVSGGLVHRYDNARTIDGLQGEEGTFNMCTFWLVEALTRAGRVDRVRLENARLLFEQMLGYANHVGLYAEETGPRGEALGNFPQALTHLALISAAFNLDRMLGAQD